MAILQCNPIANKITLELQEYIKNNRVIKRLAIIYEGKENGQQSYIKNIIRYCNIYNIKYDLWNVKESNLNKDDIFAINQLYDSIMCVKPFNKVTAKLLKDSISIKKDIDDFTDQSDFMSCTAEGVLSILKHYNISTVQNHIVIIGRGEGDKVCNLLSNKIHNATVSKIHSKTSKTMVSKLLSIADVIISATGCKDTLNINNIPSNSKKIIIDIGRGDVGNKLYNYDNLKITPKINGTGLITTQILMKHIIKGQ
ncbi:tetrahydrofolate dehydrogenase/cyclohydrolase catalytic domain-containing protein [Clostridium rectalis]|uniref:tetrahydrofolate dehydrogenase/cyclohydrolase catalytic domain-containing protein n=1 Tax=Clostridium rectalis TaxID=2040295 RepID=UPI000F631557|nr:tetrahydrofolate dehydrogenase/cyclohydrolase catalytic domain-containing protein [Clostridium rectalis]